LTPGCYCTIPRKTRSLVVPAQAIATSRSARHAREQLGVVEQIEA
jgi:hypothetical protein